MGLSRGIPRTKSNTFHYGNLLYPLCAPGVEPQRAKRARASTCMGRPSRRRGPGRLSSAANIGVRGRQGSPSTC
eukprot:6545615-Pyramimonas_sp.AAC.1